MNKNLKVKCPQCDLIFTYYESEFRPFCSERCKLIDLGHWFKETYAVPEKERNQDPNNEEQSQEKEFENDTLNEDEYDENDYK